MERLELQPTQKTPYILLDPQGRIKLKGRSIPEDVAMFYEVILHWFQEYAANPAPLTKVEVEMEYLNSGTSKYVLRFLKLLKEVEEKGNKVEINWIYEEGDDDILERGEYYASILELDIKFIEME